MADWAVTSRNGRVRVLGKRVSIKGKPRDRLNWTDAQGKQRHTMLAVDEADPDRAVRRAGQIAEEESRGASEASLSRTDRMMLLDARDVLHGSDVTVDQACRHYALMMDSLKRLDITPMEVVSRYVTSHHFEEITVSDFGIRYLDELETQGKSDRYKRDMNLMVVYLRERFGNRLVSSISRDEIETFCKLKWGQKKPKTWNKNRGTLYTIFQRAVKRGHIAANPVDEISKRKVKREVKAYTAKDVESILEHTPDEVIPWVVLQAFGCLRSAEVARLEWGKHIDLDRAIIRATEEITKTEITRIIPMSDNLVEWLKPHRQLGGKVYEGTELGIGSRNRKALAKVRKAAKVEDMDNGLRKACASHLVPMRSHIGAAAEEMGHTEAEMKRSYRELKSKEEAEEYWAIFPKAKKNRGKKTA